MAVAWRINGALAANATTTTLAIVAPTTGVVADDIFIAVILGKDNQVITVPANWTKFVEFNNTANQRVTLAWKRVVAGDEGATFNFTKPTDNNILFCGFIACFSGCIKTGSPIDATTPSTSANASSDTVSYATFDPTETAAHVVAAGVYNDDNTTAGSISGTDPTFTNRADLETALGSDGSIFLYNGSSSGAATGARSHSTTSTADAINIGVLFGLIEAAAQTFPISMTVAAVGVATLSKSATFVITLAATAVSIATLSLARLVSISLAATAVSVATLSKSLTLVNTLASTAVSIATLTPLFIAGEGGVVSRAILFIRYIGGRFLSIKRSSS